MAVTHTKVSTKADGGDTTLIRPSDWNAGHSVSVATSEIQDDAVTYAKLQNVSATDKVLGRSTTGAGDVEEIACTAAARAFLDDIDATAQRNTLVLGAANTPIFAALKLNAASNVLLRADVFEATAGLEIRDLNDVYGVRGVRAGFGLFDGTDAAAVRVTAKGAASQTANITEWQNSSAAVLAAITAGGSLQLAEMTAPAAPAANNVRVYAEDNGAGKTRLMALFPTGAAQQIAIEP